MSASVVALALLFVAQAEPPDSQTPPATAAEADTTPFDEPVTAAIVPVEGMINDVTLRSMKLRIEKAHNQGAQIIVLRMDTYGGLVTSALDISDYLKNLDLPTYTWVNPKAISAGALIALATDGIVMSPRSKIGDCAPIQAGPQGAQPMGKTEREKIETIIREEFRDSAQRNGYNEILCEAMITLGPAIYLIQHKEDESKKIFVRSGDLGKYKLKPPSEADERGGFLGLLKSAPSEWRIVEKVLEKDRLLTLSQDEALRYGFTRAIVADESELSAHFNTRPDIVTYRQDWSEQLAAWLTSPVVQSIIFLLFLLGAYMELQTPGLGLGGIVAVVCLVIMLGAPYLTGLAEVWELVLILIGVALLAVEIFLIPGFGLPGISGLILIFTGMMMAFVQSEPGNGGFIPTLPGTWAQLRMAVATLIGTLIAACVMFYFLSRHYGAIPVLNKLVLHESQRRSATVAETGASSRVESTTGQTTIRVGQTGAAVTPLRPSGRVEIDGFIIDALASGEWVQPGSKVVVTEVQDCRIVVEEVA